MIPVKPSKIICVGRNYLAHAQELGNAVPPQPMIFLKPPSALVGAGDPIFLPSQSQQVEFEGEIGVVVLERLRDVTAAAAERARLGFTCVNDVTARDLQKTDGQWGRAKGFDTFCPVGPSVVEGLDYRTLQVTTRLNGAVRQQGKTSEMAYSIPTIISFISSVMTLEPGDLIATGTPAGVGRLSAGDIVEVEVSGVGVLRNPVR
ncbi:MAG TPA: fumarylacetoacetate hydrolase family protein [Gemmatimonadales bacterium]|nr:fumarylacetoacetate hydrolase family protein [Gemmatimonadales bacterium]